MNMDIDPILIPKRKEPINLLTDVFLKSVFFLDKDISKKVIVGIFKHRGNSLGVVFNGRYGSVYWSHETFIKLSVYFLEISNAFENNIKHFEPVASKENIKVQHVFGKSYVFLFDELHTITLNLSEWKQFIRSLPLVYSELRELFLYEEQIKKYIFHTLTSKKEVDKPPSNVLPLRLGKKLFSEIVLYKQNTNVNSK